MKNISTGTPSAPSNCKNCSIRLDIEWRGTNQESLLMVIGYRPKTGYKSRYGHDAAITLALQRAHDELVGLALEPVGAGQSGDAVRDGFLEDDLAAGPLSGVQLAAAPAANQLLLAVVVHVVGRQGHDLLLRLP